MIKIEKTPVKEEIKFHYRVTCKCGCVFTCDNTDWNPVIVGHGEYDNAIRCPFCSDLIYKSPAWNGIGATLKYID